MIRRIATVGLLALLGLIATERPSLAFGGHQRGTYTYNGHQGYWSNPAPAPCPTATRPQPATYAPCPQPVAQPARPTYYYAPQTTYAAPSGQYYAPSPVR